jgi:hypothetical protein
LKLSSIKLWNEFLNLFKVKKIKLLLISDRQVLDAKYGLKRWQIGEIASKIGQLYYHY